jgi:hypothetical protein
MAGALLMTGQHVTDWAVEQRVIGGKDGPAWDAKHHLHTLVLEAAEQ